jgi:hypothetical protein
MTPLDPSHAEEALRFRTQFLRVDSIALDDVEVAQEGAASA